MGFQGRQTPNPSRKCSGSGLLPKPGEASDHCILLAGPLSAQSGSTGRASPGAPPPQLCGHSTGHRLSKGYRPAKVLVWNEILMFVGT